MASLPAKYFPLKINYNTQKEMWKMSELIFMCVQEEERLKSEQPDGAHVVINGSSKGKGKKFGKGSMQGSKNASITKTEKIGASLLHIEDNDAPKVVPNNMPPIMDLAQIPASEPPLRRSGKESWIAISDDYNDILLATIDMHMLHETKYFLSKNFDMNDLGEAFYVKCIEIHRDRSRGILGLSQRAYIDKVLKRFNMHSCSPTVALVIKGENVSLLHVLEIDWSKTKWSVLLVHQQ
ncbi:hypothetical protein RJ640_014019 [Escallonia rubra]|uniref:Reverse transcriptase Ty1/copia-type domain-containing protein n=1 Tax=Escallonia rubra TaxID=112253 RepID=A0AA88UK72_9ASTE|nr:hypothetical protein RJ640_014019 [Escallonia rubra]